MRGYAIGTHDTIIEAFEYGKDLTEKLNIQKQPLPLSKLPRYPTLFLTQPKNSMILSTKLEGKD